VPTEEPDAPEVAPLTGIYAQKDSRGTDRGRAPSSLATAWVACVPRSLARRVSELAEVFEPFVGVMRATQPCKLACPRFRARGIVTENIWFLKTN
jgi:hypothetical protein